ncbi:hypothetical protein [Nannocystis bainbridge]|uniref:Uncharacterized protein n=1 Tax=Nannocystis bainbridge TaxID=2995303 RepID=A0ABT5EAQ7_9BACT|nr:hypothetical protein [Nannocystis bainbridge]MDC0722013.1 hypothetical protein [Nannocystis bainbridge]
MLPYLVRARWTAFTLLLGCSFDGSGLVSAGPPSTTSTTGDLSTSTGPGTTTLPTTLDTEGSDSGSATTSTTTPVDPTTSTTTTTTDTSTTGPDTTTSTGPDTTTSSTTSTDTSTSTGPDTTTDPEPVCMDPGPEPNEDEAGSIDLGNQHCKAQAKSFMGILDGDTDVDWFRFHGDFSGQCGDLSPDPRAKIVVTTPGPLEVCMFADCDAQGSTNFDCPNGTSETDSPDGRDGCCGSGNMEYVVNCQSSGNESAVIYVRLQKAEVDACLEYKVDYSYLSGN